MEKKTFNDVFNNYLSYLQLNVKPTTILSIKRNFKLHILSKIGNMYIQDFSKDDFFEWQKYFKNKGFSLNFEKNVQIMFKSFFNYLEINYDVKNYPKLYGYFKNYSVQNNIKEKNIFTVHDFKKFIKFVDDPIYHALFNLLFYTGVRKGEALALKFNDLKGNYIYINKTLTTENFDGKRLELTPKTKKSIRKIRIDYRLKNELNKLQKYYNKIFNKNNGDLYIFGGINPIACTTLKRKKDLYCDKANLKHITIHDFRHSHATILYNNHIGIKTIQERLGHSNVNTTINTYVHDDIKNEKKVIKLITFFRIF